MTKNKIKTISRNWLDPRKKIDFEHGQVYQVGISDVIEISLNAEGSFNVHFNDGELLSLTDVNYVEYVSNV